MCRGGRHVTRCFGCRAAVQVRGALRRTYRDQAGNLERLNYTLCVAPIIESVLVERERQRQDQQMAAGAAASKAGVVRGAPAGPGSSFMDDDEAMAAAAAVAAPAPAGNDLGEEPPAQVRVLCHMCGLWALWHTWKHTLRSMKATLGGCHNLCPVCPSVCRLRLVLVPCLFRLLAPWLIPFSFLFSRTA